MRLRALPKYQCELVFIDEDGDGVLDVGNEVIRV